MLIVGRFTIDVIVAFAHPAGPLYHYHANAPCASIPPNQASSPTNTQTVFLELPNITGPASPPSNLTIQPLTVTYQNIPVTTIFGRLNQNGTEQRYWVSVALPIDTSIDFNSPEAFTITFLPTPITQAERVFDAIQIVSP